MGDMAFGERLRLMDRNTEDYYYKMTARFLPMLSVFSPIPWIFPFMKRIPIPNGRSTNSTTLRTRYAENASGVNPPPPTYTLIVSSQTQIQT